MTPREFAALRSAQAEDARSHDWRFGVLASLVSNMLRAEGQTPAQPADFFPRLPRVPEAALSRGPKLTDLDKEVANLDQMLARKQLTEEQHAEAVARLEAKKRVWAEALADGTT